MSNTISPPYETFVDQIIEYKNKVLLALSQDARVIALLADNPDIDMESDEAEEICKKYLWDYQYVDDTVESAGAYIMVEASKVDDNSTIQTLSLFIEVAVSKDFVELDHSKFIGMNGNRLDNIARFIDSVLNGSRDYGIGQLAAVDIRPVNAPKQFRSVLITYEPVDFGRRA